MRQTVFGCRLAHHLDELRWLYMELYENDSLFKELCDDLYFFFQERPAALKKRDLEREPEWYKSNSLAGFRKGRPDLGTMYPVKLIVPAYGFYYMEQLSKGNQ